jgi:hypothetical protein
MRRKKKEAQEMHNDLLLAFCFENMYCYILQIQFMRALKDTGRGGIHA